MVMVSPKRNIVAIGSVGVGVIVLCKIVRRLLQRRHQGHIVPFAKGWMPVFGHARRFNKYGGRQAELAMGRLALAHQIEENLDIAQVEIVSLHLYSIAHPDLAEEVVKGEPHIFTKNFRALGRSFEKILEVFGDKGLFLAATAEPAWGMAHRLLKAPFSSKGVKDMMPLMCSQADKLVETLKREVGFGGTTPIDTWVTKMAFETIALGGLGTSFGSFLAQEEHPFITALQDALTDALIVIEQPESLLWLRAKTLRRLSRNATILRDTCSEIVKKRRRQLTHSVGKNPDILDLMLTGRDPKTGEMLTDEIIVENVLNFLVAGQDSTAAAMSSCLCLLVSYPDAKAKLMKEIDDVVGDGELEWEHLSKLPYLDWCIKETLRLVPPANSLIRQVSGDQVLGGKWHIPDGAQVVISVFALHYNPNYWGSDVSLFKPERWQSGPSHKFAYMPFASGPRACIGREFSIVEQKVTLVKLLQHFDFRRPDKVVPQKHCQTIKRENILPPMVFNTDLEFKDTGSFAGVYSAFELLKRTH